MRGYTNGGPVLQLELLEKQPLLAGIPTAGEPAKLPARPIRPFGPTRMFLESVVSIETICKFGQQWRAK
jgi:hypothetical protein